MSERDLIFARVPVPPELVAVVRDYSAQFGIPEAEVWEDIATRVRADIAEAMLRPSEGTAHE